MPVVAAPTKPSIQIRPISQMQPSQDLTASAASVASPPQITYACSFCNEKQSSQVSLIKHLGQHVNFGGSNPSDIDIKRGYTSLKIQSQVQAGMWKTKFMCLSCGKMFAKDQQVKIHLNVHYGDNIYNCRFCEKVFANYATFEVCISMNIRLKQSADFAK